MKQRFLLVFLPFMLLLASCSTERDFTKRKYLPGFFNDRAGERNTETAVSPEHRSLLQAKAEEPNALSVSADTIPQTENENIVATEKPVIQSAEKAVADKGISTPNAEKIPGQPDPKEWEQKRIKQAFYEAIGAIALFILGVAAMLLLPEILTGLVLLLLAYIFSAAGMVDARKVRKMHDKGEDYPGKNKVIFARVIGITGLALIGLAVAFILFVLAALTL